MDCETITRLDDVNRRFYAAYAEEFLATRASPWPGWARLLPRMRELAPTGAPLRILDVGCGNGRLGSWLERHLDRPHRYVGLDRSLSLLARASCASARMLTDLVASGGRVPVETAAFDVVLVLALLHHVPSFRLRRALLDDLLRLLRPGGLLALSFWQFGAEERFARRAVSAETYADLAAPLDATQLEHGDHLLRWGEDPAAPAAVRYCHFADPEETASLIADLPAKVVESFYADGREQRLNLYLIAVRS